MPTPLNPSTHAFAKIVGHLATSWATMSPDACAQEPPPYPSPILMEPLADAAVDEEEEEVVPAAVVECHHDDHHEITCPHVPCTCPEPSCHFAASSAALFIHLIVVDSRRVRMLPYGVAKPFQGPKPVPGSPATQVYGQGEDDTLFVINIESLGGGVGRPPTCLWCASDLPHTCCQSIE